MFPESGLVHVMLIVLELMQQPQAAVKPAEHDVPHEQSHAPLSAPAACLMLGIGQTAVQDSATAS
jgi:hypothetical protein